MCLRACFLQRENWSHLPKKREEILPTHKYFVRKVGLFQNIKVSCSSPSQSCSKIVRVNLSFLSKLWARIHDQSLFFCMILFIYHVKFSSSGLQIRLWVISSFYSKTMRYWIYIWNHVIRQLWFFIFPLWTDPVFYLTALIYIPAASLTCVHMIFVSLILA